MRFFGHRTFLVIFVPCLTNCFSQQIGNVNILTLDKSSDKSSESTNNQYKNRAERTIELYLNPYDPLTRVASKLWYHVFSSKENKPPKLPSTSGNIESTTSTMVMVISTEPKDCSTVKPNGTENLAPEISMPTNHSSTDLSDSITTSSSIPLPGGEASTFVTISTTSSNHEEQIRTSTVSGSHEITTAEATSSSSTDAVNGSSAELPTTEILHASEITSTVNPSTGIPIIDAGNATPSGESGESTTQPEDQTTHQGTEQGPPVAGAGEQVVQVPDPQQQPPPNINGQNTTGQSEHPPQGEFPVQQRPPPQGQFPGQQTPPQGQFPGHQQPPPQFPDLQQQPPPNINGQNTTGQSAHPPQGEFPVQQPPPQGQFPDQQTHPQGQFPGQQTPPQGQFPGHQQPPPQGQFPGQQQPPPQGQFPGQQQPPPQGQFPGQQQLPPHGQFPGQQQQGQFPGQQQQGQFPGQHQQGQFPGQQHPPPQGPGDIFIPERPPLFPGQLPLPQGQQPEPHPGAFPIHPEVGFPSQPQHQGSFPGPPSQHPQLNPGIHPPPQGSNGQLPPGPVDLPNFYPNDPIIQQPQTTKPPKNPFANAKPQQQIHHREVSTQPPNLDTFLDIDTNSTTFLDVDTNSEDTEIKIINHTTTEPIITTKVPVLPMEEIRKLSNLHRIYAAIHG